MRTFHACLAASIALWPGLAAVAGGVSVTNLITDDQSANPAQIADPALKNAWGISRSDTSPFWVSANGTGVSTIYQINGASNAVAKQPLTVTIPGAGNPTGQVFNPTASFNGDRFLFVSEDGTVSGWRPALGTNAEVLQTGLQDNVYKGVALGSVNGNDYLYAANFRAGTVDVLKGNPAAPNLTGHFVDPALPSGYAPFNIANIGGKLYVTYAQRETSGEDDVPGVGHGFVDVFDAQGNLASRFATQGTLNSPWGMAVAPGSFGGLSGDLLVGNFGDGHINAFDLGTHAFEGQVMGTNGQPVTIDGLWALIQGNGAQAGSTQKLYFSAGPDGEMHGLVGVLTASVPEPGSLALMGAMMFALLAVRCRSSARAAR